MTSSILVACITLAAIAPATAKPGGHHVPRPSEVGARAPTPAESQFYIKGPNAPFQNQTRKLRDPLNANGSK